jgi:hypothetical protein
VTELRVYIQVLSGTSLYLSFISALQNLIEQPTDCKLATTQCNISNCRLERLENRALKSKTGLNEGILKFIGKAAK